MLWRWKKGQGFYCGEKGTFPWPTIPCCKKEAEDGGQPERSRICLQVERSVGMTLVCLKLSQFVVFCILQYSLVFRHLTFQTIFPEELFVRDGGNPKIFENTLSSASQKHMKWKLCTTLIHQSFNLFNGFIIFHFFVYHLILSYSSAFPLEIYCFHSNALCLGDLLLFLWGRC